MRGIGEEEFEEKAEERGYETIHLGALDFLVWSSSESDHEKAYIVEVKSNKDNLSKKQRKTKAVFESIGIPVFVSREGEWKEPKEDNKENVEELSELKKKLEKESKELKKTEEGVSDIKESLYHYRKRYNSFKRTIRVLSKTLFEYTPEKTIKEMLEDRSYNFKKFLRYHPDLSMEYNLSNIDEVPEYEKRAKLLEFWAKKQHLHYKTEKKMIEKSKEIWGDKTEME